MYFLIMHLYMNFIQIFWRKKFLDLSYFEGSEIPLPLVKLSKTPSVNIQDLTFKVPARRGLDLVGLDLVEVTQANLTSLQDIIGPFRIYCRFRYPASHQFMIDVV